MTDGERKYQSDDIKELATALAKAQGQFEHAKKDSDNPFFRTKYADLAAVYNASRAKLAENGLAVTQVTEFSPDGITLVTTLLHSSGQWMRSWYPVRPAKPNDPQALGSTITYARRYAYCAMIGVAAEGEDDDGNAASERTLPHDSDRQPVQEEQSRLESYNAAKAKYAIEPKVMIDGSRDYDVFATELEQAIFKAGSMNEVSMYKKANAKTLNAMEKDRPELLEHIKSVFTEVGNKFA
jgi:hypothetical protein